MIEEMILLKRAKEIGIEIPEDEFKSAIAAFKNEYPEGVFEETLIENAVSYNYWKKRLKIRLLMEKVIAKEFGDQVKITAEDISRYYEEYYQGRGQESDSDSNSDPYKEQDVEDTEEMVLKHLRWKKTEEAYQSWMKEIKQKQTIEINGKKWKEMINS